MSQKTYTRQLKSILAIREGLTMLSEQEYGEAVVKQGRLDERKERADKNVIFAHTGWKTYLEAGDVNTDFLNMHTYNILKSTDEQKRSINLQRQAQDITRVKAHKLKTCQAIEVEIKTSHKFELKKQAKKCDERLMRDHLEKALINWGQT